MGDLNSAFQALKSFCTRNERATFKGMKNYFGILLRKAQNDGLPEDILEVCSQFLNKQCNSSGMMCALLKCMIPVKTMPNPVTSNVLKAIYNFHNLNYKQAVVIALQWIAGLLEFGLADEKLINEYYYMFYAFLNLPATERIACWLVVRLTKPEDVDRNMVVKLLSSELKSKSRTKDTILWCYKTFKPECVPEPVASRSVVSALKSNSYYKLYFGRAYERFKTDPTSPEVEESGPVWKIPTKRKRRHVELIPYIQHVYFGSNLYRGKETSVLKVNNWKQLSAFILNLGLPCNMMSLLENPFGHHILAFGDEYVQNKLSYTLHHTLQIVIIDKLVQVPLQEQEELLNKVCEFQECMQQGIPVMSRFIADYLIFWDGITFLHQLMKLLPWITFSTFSELKNFFLVHLYYVYISSNIRVKCGILRALTKLVQNVVLLMSNIEGKLFCHSQKLDNGEEILEKLIEFVQTLCNIGLRFEPDSVLLMNEVLRLHEMLVEDEERSKLNIRTIVPPIIVYLAVFSRNYTNIERVCHLLVKYNTSIDVQKSLQMEVPETSQIIHKYSSDLMNILWWKRAYSGRNDGYIFKEINKTQIKNVWNLFNVDNVFHIRKHVSFICISVRNSNKSRKEQKKICLNSVKRLSPNLYSFLIMNSSKKQT